MSGIIGIVRPDGAPTEGVADAMLRRVAARGPDRQLLWTGSGISLGHALLATTPEAVHEVQPLQSSDGRFVLVADARIDNRTELLQALRLRASRSAISDADLLFAGFRRWGQRVVDYLVGDYAFAVWDSTERVLFCARDPVGIRPFFYHSSSRGVVFASSIPAVRACPDVPDAVNEAHLLVHLADREPDPRSTFYAGIRRLPPSNALQVDATGAVKEWRYWRPEETIDERQFQTDREYEEGFREVFETAVQSCLRTAGPVGIALSGGLDSSAVASVAHHVRSTGEAHGPLHTFTGIFRDVSPQSSADRDPRLDEWSYAQAVLNDIDAEAHLLRADWLSPLYGMEATVEHYGQPFKSRSHYLITQFVEAAREEGIRVVIDGLEGDLVVGYGHDYFQQLADEGRWEAFARVATAYEQNCRRGGRRYPAQRAFWEHGADALWNRLQTTVGRTALRELPAVYRHLGISPTAMARRKLRGQLRHRLPGKRPNHAGNGAGGLIESERLSEPGGGEVSSQNPEPILERRAQLILQNPVLGETLDGVDALTTNRGVEARHPFFDRRVVEYCLSLPPEQRLKGGWTRSILRRSLRGVLPDLVRKRVGKSNLGINIEASLMQHEGGRLRQATESNAVHAFVTPTRARSAWNRFEQHPKVSTAKPVIQLAIVDAWLQRREREGKADPHSVPTGID